MLCREAIWANAGPFGIAVVGAGRTKRPKDGWHQRSRRPTADSKRPERRELHMHVVANLETGLKELLERLVAVNSRSRVLVCATAHPSCDRCDGLTQEELDRALVMRHESLIVDGDVEEAF
jgi:hypothetical protein